MLKTHLSYKSAVELYNISGHYKIQKPILIAVLFLWKFCGTLVSTSITLVVITWYKRKFWLQQLFYESFEELYIYNFRSPYLIQKQILIAAMVPHPVHCRDRGLPPFHLLKKKLHMLKNTLMIKTSVYNVHEKEKKLPWQENMEGKSHRVCTFKLHFHTYMYILNLKKGKNISYLKDNT